jgi:hypothetical protein
MSEDELVLQGAGRDLRPRYVDACADITSSGAAALENDGASVDDTRLAADETDADDAAISPTADFDTEAAAPETTGGDAVDADTSDGGERS